MNKMDGTSRNLGNTRTKRVRSYVDPVASEFARTHAGLRTYGDHEVPAYVDGSNWLPVPHRVNNYGGKQRLPERCLTASLAAKDTQQRGPNGASTGECFQLDLRGEDETQPVLPTLFVPGFPKSATTWLYECMHNAFLPEVVCPAARRPRPSWHEDQPAASFDSRSWNKTGCLGRRYMLPGIACSVLGGCAHRKELFFYGAGFGDYFKVGMAALHGPELPLSLFARSEAKPVTMGKHQWDYYRVRRFEEFCTNPKFTHLPPGRMHPSCCVARSTWPKRWGCRWHESLRLRFGRSRSVWFQVSCTLPNSRVAPPRLSGCFQTAMPWVQPKEFEFASVDFTPNYLCHSGALQNIYDTARDPSELRFIVLMRDPIMRAFSEWSMFALGWCRR